MSAEKDQKQGVDVSHAVPFSYGEVEAGTRFLCSGAGTTYPHPVMNPEYGVGGTDYQGPVGEH